MINKYLLKKFKYKNYLKKCTTKMPNNSSKTVELSSFLCLFFRV